MGHHSSGLSQAACLTAFRFGARPVSSCSMAATIRNDVIGHWFPLHVQKIESKSRFYLVTEPWVLRI